MNEINVISLLLRSRFFERKIEEEFKKGNLYGTTHLSIGQEASHTGLCLALDEGDWFVPTHRCHGFNIASGSNMEAMFAEMLGSKNGLCKGLGGSMHMTDVERYNLGSSAVVGSGIPLAGGAAFALKRQNKDNIAVAILGDGASSRGSLHEMMNLSSVWHLPLLYYMENNHYGMSASSSRMISTSSIASRSIGYGIEYETVDGNDFDAVYSAVKRAREYILKNKKPYFIESNTYRLCGHSKSDKRLYRDREEEREWEKKDPIALYVKKHSISAETFSQIKEEEQRRVDDAWLNAWEKRFDVLSKEEAEEYVIPPAEKFVSKDGGEHKATYREAVREALGEILEKDERVSFIGEDIGLYGGCFSVSGELYKSFPDRVIETPVSEEAFSGLAIGASFLGERPIVEIMYGDFLTLASDAIINHGAKSYFMSAGQLKCPVIFRTACGGGTGHGAQHTQSLESMFLNVPGLKVVAPSSPLSAKALLKGASYENCPVLFLEHKALYNEEDVVEGSEYILPLGKAIVEERGESLLVIGYSRPFRVARKALEGYDATFLDIASLKPLDEEAICSHGAKFSSILIVEDTPLRYSVAETVFRLIRSVNRDAHIEICHAPDMPLAFSKTIERETLLSEAEIIKKANIALGKIDE